MKINYEKPKNSNIYLWRKIYIPRNIERLYYHLIKSTKKNIELNCSTKTRIKNYKNFFASFINSSALLMNHWQ
jgi:hypothetical protein